MPVEWKFVRIHKTTQSKIRKIAAWTDEKICEVLERWAEREIKEKKIPVPKDLK